MRWFRISAWAMAAGALLLLPPACGSPTSPTRDSSTDARVGCGQEATRTGDAFISLDGESQFEVESFLVERAGDLAIAWEAYGCDDLTRVGYTRRRGGTSFERIRYLASPDGQMASNVTLAQDARGSLFAAWASWTPGPDRAQPHVDVSDIHIQLARWTAGTDGFAAPVALDEPIASALYDKPWVIVTADDRVIVSFSDFRRGGIWTAASADGGETFQRTLIDATMGNLASLCPDGRPGGAFITYVVAGALRLAHTADGGRSWSTPRNAAVADATGAVAYQDPMCVARGDEVWVSYGRTQDSYDTPVTRLRRVHVAHLTLGAAAAVTDVIALAVPSGSVPSDDAGAGDGAGPFLLFPQLASGPDGALVLAAYRAAGEGIGTAELVYVTSTDGALSFGDATTVAHGLTPSLRRHVPDWLGDYFGWGPTRAGIGAAFIDNASGFSHVVFSEDVLSMSAH